MSILSDSYLKKDVYIKECLPCKFRKPQFLLSPFRLVTSRIYELFIYVHIILKIRVVGLVYVEICIYIKIYKSDNKYIECWIIAIWIECSIQKSRAWIEKFKFTWWVYRTYPVIRNKFVVNKCFKQRSQVCLLLNN